MFEPVNDEYTIVISRFMEVYIKEVIELGTGQRVKHLVATVPPPFRGKYSGPPYVYVWWYTGGGQYFYTEDLEALLLRR
jgi:hypothetical protein